MENEPYEMFCCKEAIKIATYCSVNRVATEFEGDEPTAAENVLAFKDLPYEDQIKAGLDDGHSGNTFGFAVRLAYLWVTDPGRVVQEHGALVPLLGCKAYGYKAENGASCSDLHAYLIRELGKWFDDRGVKWYWCNEFTGDIFEGYDGLSEFGHGVDGEPEPTLTLNPVGAWP